MIAVREATHHIGDALCTTGVGETALYEVPDAPEGEDDEFAVAFFYLLPAAIDGQTICSRYDGDPERGYRSRSFLPDGHVLAELDEHQDHVTIVPAAPIDQLVKP